MGYMTSTEDMRRVIRALESIASSLEKIAAPPEPIYSLDVQVEPRPTDQDIVDSLTGVIDGMERTKWSDMTEAEQIELNRRYNNYYVNLSNSEKDKAVVAVFKNTDLDERWEVRQDLLEGKIKLEDL